MNFSQTASMPVHLYRSASFTPSAFFDLFQSTESHPYIQSVGAVLLIAGLACTSHVLKANSRRQNRPLNRSVQAAPVRTDEKPRPVVDPETLYRSAFPDIAKAASHASEAERRRMAEDKELYWKLQNVEDHPDAVQLARARLIQLFDKTLAEAQTDPANTILSLDQYDRSTLRPFLATSHQSATARYESYLQRRRAGGPREIFPTAEFAKEWLRLAGVVKYVDGGWLGAILGVGTGKTGGDATGDEDNRLERKVSKMAWQVISEEFGDGDLQKNHVHLYEASLAKINAGAPAPPGETCPGNVRGFDGLTDDQGVPRCWEAAIAQQCIGLLASTRDFFPEALGFNMAYEALPYHLLVTARELKELRIDNYYFAIHVTIDNADSGHSAMARLAVERYLEGVRERDGQQAMEQMWRRVQMGYILAEGLPTTPSGPVEFEPVVNASGPKSWQPRLSPVPTSSTEAKLAHLVVRKAAAADKMHCTSRMTIGGETVEEWMNPATLTHERAVAFLRALADKRPFVIPGEPVRSRFVRDLEWGGRMFGAFSRSETDAVRDWIRSLKPQVASQDSAPAGGYDAFVGAILPSVDTAEPASSFERCARDLWTDHDLTIPPARATIASASVTDQPLPLPSLPAKEMWSRVRPVYYLSSSLLECFPLQPSKYASSLGMITLRLIRSQLGFDDLHRSEDICAGTDDIGIDCEQDTVGLWELGEKMDAACGFKPYTNVITLAQGTTDPQTNSLCADLLTLRHRPYANASILLGATLALCQGLHASVELSSLLTASDDQAVLRRIAEEERAAIRDYLEAADPTEGFMEGYSWVHERLSSICA
ncbi:hypothetical protein IAU60_003747 [Kwoniella sp. DSM 27419]